MDTLRRFAVEGLILLIGIALQIGGYHNEPLAWVLIIVGVGWGLVALVTWKPVHDIYHTIPRLRIIDTSRQPLPSAPATPPTFLSGTLMYADLNGLKATDSYVLLTVRVTNHTGRKMRLEGVNGQARIGGAECNWPAKLDGGPRDLEPGRYDITIKQPITAEMAAAIACYDLRGDAKRLNLCDADHRVALDLTGIVWIGVLDDEPLPRTPVVDAEWLMWGPFYPNDDDGDSNVLMSLRAGLVSQKYWFTDGRPRIAEKSAEPEAKPPTWFDKAIKQDADDLRGAMAFIDEQPQNYHVLFDLEHKDEPGIFFRYMMLNTSVYRVEVTEVDGILQMTFPPEGGFERVAGYWKVEESQLPFVFGRRMRHNLFLKFVLPTEQTQNRIKSLVEKCREDNTEICFELNNLKLRLRAQEDPTVVAELRFNQQYWRPSHERGHIQ